MSGTSMRIGGRCPGGAAVWCVLAIALAGGAATAQDAQPPGSAAPTEDADQSRPQTQQPVPAKPPKEQEAAQGPENRTNVSWLLVVVGPLAAVAALMGLYWLILRRGAI